MKDTVEQALRSAAASSAMEGMPLEARHIDTIQQILNGKITVQEYLSSLKAKTQEA